MAFLNASLLFGLCAIGIPLALHLLGRRQPRPVVFPAVRFLHQRLEKNRRRIQVKKWLLLLLRMLVVGLAALALAQPAIAAAEAGTWLSIGVLFVLATAVLGLAVWAFVSGRPRLLAVGLAIFGGVLFAGSVAWGGVVLSRSGRTQVTPRGPAAVAIVLDNSLRMTYRDGDEARLAKAKAAGDWLLSRYPIDSRFAVLDLSARPASFAIDVAAARRSLSSAKPVAVSEPIQQRAADAIRLVRTSRLERKAVYVLTDLSAVGWREPAEPPLAELLGSEEDEVLLQVVDFGGENRVNLSIPRVQLPLLPIAEGVPVRLEVELSASLPSAGRDEAPGEPVESGVELHLYQRDPGLPLQRDGKVVLPPTRLVDRRPLRLTPGTSAVTLLDLPALESGVWFAEVRQTRPDPIPADDVQPIVIEVAPAPTIHVASDEQRERQAMAQLLAPKDLQIQGQTEYVVSTSSLAELNDTDLPSLDALIMIDPATLDARTVSWIRSGGRALICMGPSWTTGGGQRTLASDAAAGLLVATAARQWRVPDDGTFLQITDSQHPGLVDLAQETDVPWPVYPVYRYWQVAPDEAAAVPVQYAATGHPAIVDGPVDAGRVIVATTPLPALSGSLSSWNDLLSNAPDVWPAFLLTRGLVRDLSRPPVGTINVAVGAPVVLPRAATAPDRYQLFTPDGEPVAVGARLKSIVPGPPAAAGLYWLRAPGTLRGYAAQLTPPMTDVTRIDAATLQEQIGDTAAPIASSTAEIRFHEGSGGSSRPFYAQLIVLVCLLWVLEGMLASRFYRDAGQRATTTMTPQPAGESAA